jgi:3-oxoadipate enol-lactonase
MEFWGSFADRIAAVFPVIAFDPRGVGHSSDPPLFHSTRAMANDAIELLRVLRVDRAHVFGLSLGGMVASWMAVDAPGLVSRLALASTLPSAGTVWHRRARDLLRLLRSVAVVPAGEPALVRAVLSPEFRHEHPERVRSIEAMVRAAPTRRRNLAVLLSASLRHDVNACFCRLNVKTLLLLGSRDRIADRRSQRELMRVLPHARLVVISHAGHDLSLEQPERTADALIDFLSSP